MAQINIKGVSPEREAFVKGQQERGITSRGGVSPQREQYLRDAQKPKISVQEFDSEVIEAKPVNKGRTEMQNRPINSRMPSIGANPVDINAARSVASDMVNNGNYKHPEYKAKLQAMFPKPAYALGGIVKGMMALDNEQYKSRPDTFHDSLPFDNMTTDNGSSQTYQPIINEPRKMSIGNALALRDSSDNGFDNMTTDSFKKGGVVKKQTETNRQRLGAINYKEGGTIKGPGTGTSDSIDADLPVGSAIIPAAQRALYGDDFFDKLEAIADAAEDKAEGETEATESEHMPMAKPQLGMKCGGVAKMSEGGIVPAKVSNGERYLTPEAVKFFGQKFVNTLIHAKPEDVKEEMGEVKGGRVHAKLGDGDMQPIDKSKEASKSLQNPTFLNNLVSPIENASKGFANLVQGNSVDTTVPDKQAIGIANPNDKQVQEELARVQNASGAGNLGAKFADKAVSFIAPKLGFEVKPEVIERSKGFVPNESLATQPTTQVKNVAQPATSSQPVANMPIGDNAQSPKLGVVPQPKTMANAATEAPINAPIGVTQTQQPYSTRLGNMGDKVNTLNVAGKGQMQFADGRTLMPEQASGLQDTISRNADPAFQARLADQAKIVNDRMGWAKQNDLERNARLGNPAAANTLKSQADTQQAQLAKQANADTIGYNREKDQATLAQNKELKQMELNQPKPITTNTYSPEGTLTGQDVGVVQYDKEGNPALKKLSQNAEDKEYAEFSSFPQEKINMVISNAQKVLADPKNPKYANALKIATMYQRLLQSQNQQQ